MLLKIRLILVSFSFITNVFTYNILAVFPHYGKSHLWIFKPIIEELATRGHNLTVILHHSFNIDVDGYQEILLHNPNFKGTEMFTIGFDDILLFHHRAAVMLIEDGLSSSETLLSNPEVQKLIKSDEKFDLVFAEFFNNECALGFANRFKAPLIAISSSTMIPSHNDFFANPENPAYIPDSQYYYGEKMTFLERVDNFLMLWFHKMVHYIYLNSNKVILDKYFKDEMPDLMKLARNTSLIFVNSHFSLTFAKPLVPGVVEIGGVHIENAKRLPQNIEKFINESTHGVIYFSLGSMIKGHTFPQDKREEFLRAFARLPQRVLWKWENETMPGKPDNVMIQKWMPQFDILSHPNVKAFISHGGLLGTTEAVHCGVPMVVMPQYGDQHTNAKAVEANGGGVILYLKEATEEKVYQSLKTVLDPEFKAKAEALSARFRDRPMSPMDTAIYWVEYVARHKGAPHLRTAAVDMPLYQYLLLDVIAFLLAIAFVLTYITYKTTCLIFRALIKRKKMKQN